MTAAQTKTSPARVVAVIAAIALSASFFLPAMTFSGGGGSVNVSGQAGTGWDLCEGSFNLMRIVGTPDGQVRGEQWKLYIMAYAWTANLSCALVLLGCACGWTQARVLWWVLAIAGGIIGITGVVVLFSEHGNPGPASLAWCGALVLALIAASLMPKAR